MILKANTIDEIKNSAREIAARPVSSLRQMARASWEYAREHHTREAFGRQYRIAIDEILADLGLSHVTAEARAVPRTVRVQASLTESLS
jgi:hypothetical protein